MTVEDQTAAIESVADHYSDAAIDRLDGLTVSWDDRWFNLRPSNTEPLLRLNVEAPDGQAVGELVAGVRELVEGRS